MTGPLCWVVLTQGTRPDEVDAAVRSIRSGDPDEVDEVVVVHNGGPGGPHPDGARELRSDENVGVPGGRDLAVRATSAPIVGFLDDDARLVTPDAAARIVDRFVLSSDLGALSFRIVDEEGGTSRRHVPRVGSGSVERAGDVVNFLGGACAIRRSAYEAAGGFWADLFYAHEELDLAWRLHQAGYRVVYDPSIVVAHPRTEVSRHENGWRLTGRNRVMIARRDLPWPIAIAHVTVWLVIGFVRAPDRSCRGAYLRGWWSGWRRPVDRRPISWRTVRRLTRLGRPPLI